MTAELHQVSKVYGIPGKADSVTVLDDISLLIPPGSSVAITGPSGSGKSTLLNILGTLDNPTSGKVLLNGKCPQDLDDKSLAGLRNTTIGFVFQLHHLLPQLTLLENVLLPLLPEKDTEIRKKARERALQLIDYVDLLSHINYRPGQLSVGECQRAAVVRALINQPKLLLADEPTGSLDSENALQMARLLANLQHKHHFSMVVVTHSQELASIMDIEYRLAFGELNKVR